MPAVVIARADDEIVDLIDRVRSSADLDVGLVVPTSSRALQTPVNVRLVAQVSHQSGRRTPTPTRALQPPLNVRLRAKFTHQSGRRTWIVTEDPRVQQLARANGLQVY